MGEHAEAATSNSTRVDSSVQPFGQFVVSAVFATATHPLTFGKVLIQVSSLKCERGSVQFLDHPNCCTTSYPSSVRSICVLCFFGAQIQFDLDSNSVQMECKILPDKGCFLLSPKLQKFFSVP